METTIVIVFCLHHKAGMLPFGLNLFLSGFMPSLRDVRKETNEFSVVLTKKSAILTIIADFSP